MRTSAFVILLVGLLSVSTLADFAHGPYSGAPDETGVTIAWLSDELFAAARIEYTVESHYQANGSFDTVHNVPHGDEEKPRTYSVRLDGLELGTRYAYRVVTTVDEVDRASRVGTFRTEPGSGEAIRFAVLSDTQLQHEGTNRLELVGDAIGEAPGAFDFILHAGDLVEGSSTYYWDHWFDSFDDMLLRAPFLPVLGNHEKNHRYYYEYFTLPPGGGKLNERWWALHYGDVVVVGLDTNVRRADEIRAQQEWASVHLSGAEPHKFVIFHHPVFTSDSEYGTGFFYDSIYHPIFVENEVDIVFNGHSHHYENILRDGVRYLVVGGGGARPRYTRPDHIKGSDVSIEQHYFYVTVATDPSGIAVETVSVARESEGTVIPTPDEILDSFAMSLETPDDSTVASTEQPEDSSEPIDGSEDIAMQETSVEESEGDEPEEALSSNVRWRRWQNLLIGAVVLLVIGGVFALIRKKST